MSFVNAPLRVLTSLSKPLSEPSNVEGSSEDSKIRRRAVYDRTSQETHTKSDRTDCQTHRLGLNLPTDDSVEVSVPLLLQSYREKYPSDPVTEQEFAKLVDEMRPDLNEVERQTTPGIKTAHAESQVYPVAKQVSPMNNNDEHERTNERDGSLEPQTTSIFTEFVNGWKKLRPNGALSNDQGDAAGRQPRRKLNVLSWGFGE